MKANVMPRPASSRKSTVRWTSILIVIAAIAALPAATHAAAGKKEFKPGATCKRQTDSFPGVVKMDACHRVYCGRKDIKDITEIDPNIAERLHCTWVLVGDHCKCRRNDNMTPRQP
jgi:hypothetical protein